MNLKNKFKKAAIGINVCLLAASCGNLNNELLAGRRGVRKAAGNRIKKQRKRKLETERRPRENKSATDRNSSWNNRNSSWDNRNSSWDNRNFSWGSNLSFVASRLIKIISVSKDLLFWLFIVRSGDKAFSSVVDKAQKYVCGVDKFNYNHNLQNTKLKEHIKSLKGLENKLGNYRKNVNSPSNDDNNNYDGKENLNGFSSEEQKQEQKQDQKPKQKDVKEQKKQQQKEKDAAFFKDMNGKWENLRKDIKTIYRIRNWGLHFNSNSNSKVIDYLKYYVCRILNMVLWMFDRKTSGRHDNRESCDFSSFIKEAKEEDDDFMQERELEFDLDFVNTACKVFFNTHYPPTKKEKKEKKKKESSLPSGQNNDQ